MTTFLRAAVGVVALAAAGCSGGSVTVTGKVAYQGKPVVFGSVVVIGKDGLPKAGLIEPDGTFRIAGVVPGSVQVAVSSPPPPGAAPAPKPRGGRTGGDWEDDEKILPTVAGDPAVAKAWFPIPDRYGDPAKSGLTATVGSGQPLDLDLK
jgi:hypothetical protein